MKRDAPRAGKPPAAGEDERGRAVFPSGIGLSLSSPGERARGRPCSMRRSRMRPSPQGQRRPPGASPRGALPAGSVAPRSAARRERCALCTRRERRPPGELPAMHPPGAPFVAHRRLSDGDGRVARFAPAAPAALPSCAGPRGTVVCAFAVGGIVGCTVGSHVGRTLDDFERDRHYPYSRRARPAGSAGRRGTASPRPPGRVGRAARDCLGMPGRHRAACTVPRFDRYVLRAYPDRSARTDAPVNTSRMRPLPGSLRSWATREPSRDRPARSTNAPHAHP